MRPRRLVRRPPPTIEAGFSLAEMLVVIAVLGFMMAAVFGVYQATQQSTFRASGSEDAQTQVRAVIDKIAADLRMVNAGRFGATTAISTACVGTTTWAICTARTDMITFKGDIDSTVDGNGNLITVATAQVNAGAASMTVSSNSNIGCGTDITLMEGPITETHTLAATGCTSAGNVVNFQAADTLATYYAVGDIVSTVETVTWAWDSASGNLCRSANTVNGNGTNCTGAVGTWSATTDIIATGVTNFSLSYLDANGNTIAMSGAPAAVAAGSLATIRAITATVTINSQSGNQSVSRTMTITVRPRNL